MGISMFLQMRLNPAPPDPVQAKIFQFMPLFFTFLLATFPAGLVIYWTWNNALSMAQPMVCLARDGSELAVNPEVGRRLFVGACDFVAAANNMKATPRGDAARNMFQGCSNVGKSSLVNALTGRKTLARTSQTPGRTRQLILIWLTGYNWSICQVTICRRPKTDIKAWNSLTRKFLAGRPSLQRVFLLIDSRRGIGATDRDIMTLLDKTAVSWAVVMTKADKQKPEALRAVCAATESAINKHVAAYPGLFVTSSQTGAGIDTLRAHMAGFAVSKPG